MGNNVVFGFGALEAEWTGNLYSGWVMAYNKTTLAQTGIFATETVGNGGAGVWQSGRPPVVDSSGYVYVFTGNGYTTGYDGVNNFSESVLKLNPANGLSLVDWFTPSNWSTLDNDDLDLASSGPMLVPGTSLLAGGGKAGVLYVLNTGGLGHETANDSGAVQEITISRDAGRTGVLAALRRQRRTAAVHLGCERCGEGFCFQRQHACDHAECRRHRQRPDLPRRHPHALREWFNARQCRAVGDGGDER